MAMQLPEDFKEFLKLLNSAEVKYLLVGGFAVTLHGHPRTTGDMDIWVPTNKDTAAKLLGVLEQFGFGNAGATAELLQTPSKVIRMGMPPLRIELLTGISGVKFEDCWERKDTLEIDGITIQMISKQDLLVNKKAAGRPQDIADVDKLSE
ncbi:MAG: nucleotidyltransferase [Pirellulales bacterium]|jgi:predicted nucleotidyltransferase|nr:nucleotidyltransferase [Pirellulales bacterium]